MKHCVIDTNVLGQQQLGSQMRNRKMGEGAATPPPRLVLPERLVGDDVRPGTAWSAGDDGIGPAGQQ